MASTLPNERTRNPGRDGLLLRRLMITCPITQTPTDTGFELTSVPELVGDAHWLIDCLECGQDHP